MMKSDIQVKYSTNLTVTNRTLNIYGTSPLAPLLSSRSISHEKIYSHFTKLRLI